jgi:GNAT superfamily N-acetyltransferase
VTRLRTRGPREVLSLTGARLKESVSSHEVLIVLRRATRSEAPIRPKVAGLELRILGPEDAAEYARRVGTDSATSFRRRLSSSTKCYAVDLGGLLVHSSWVTTACAWTREVNGFFCAGPASAYVFESFTHPDARGKGVYPFALDGICSAIAGEEIETLWVAVESSNEPSLRAVAKAGFDESFRIGYHRKAGRVVVAVPQEVKTDTTARRALKKRRIWLSGDGAEKQWKP